MKRGTVGGSTALTIESQGASVSVLVPSQTPLVYRGYSKHKRLKILIWFADVERLAWEYVNTFFARNPPASIFLVTGQTLTREYSICTLATNRSSCKVSIEPSVSLAGLVEAHLGLGYGLQSANASAGFQIQVRYETRPDPLLALSSVYLQVYESFRIRRLQLVLGTTLADRVMKMFKYKALL